MKLHDTLSEATVLLNLESRPKDEAIAAVAEPLRSVAAVTDADEFLKAVCAREATTTTGIGGGVAIPHARSDGVSDFVAALGVFPDGVDFQDIDDKPVKLVILMGIPASQVKGYLRMLAHLSLLLKQPGFLDRLYHARSSREALDVLAEYEA